MSTPVSLVKRSVSPVTASRLRARGANDLLSKIYAARGVTNIAEVRGTYDDLLPVSSMKNVQPMASYLADCLVRKKRVLIISDYDCDGATACAVLVMAFVGSGMDSDYLVPDRMVHGYGLTPAIVEEAAALVPKPDVIITVDNGISSTAGVDRANQLGIEVLVTDHHLAPDVLPNAKLIVNPNQPGCNFESKNIAGCGVAWYVARAYLEELAARNMDSGFEASELLSYVAVGTVADVVKLDRNNRTLVRLGLELIRKGECAPGIGALARIAGKNPAALTCADIGFGIGPRINAAGRLAHMDAGIECITSLDFDAATIMAKHLNETNEERKDIQREMVDEAVVQAVRLINRDVSIQTDSYGRRSVVVFHPDWHEGVVGIVAGRLKEDRHRPTVVMTNAHDGTIKGSGRSIPGFHLKHALDEINAALPGVLLKFGGHAMAAGMTIAADRLNDFRDELERVCQAGLTPEMMTKTLLHDGELPEHHFNVESVHALSQEVWGQGFEEPVFLNRLAVSSTTIIGSDKSHLKLRATLGQVETDVMAFGQADLAECITTEMVVAHKPQVNLFQGERVLQVLVDLMPEELNPCISAGLRAREALEMQAADASAGTSHDPVAAPSAPPDTATPGPAQGAGASVLGVSPTAPTPNSLGKTPAAQQPGPSQAAQPAPSVKSGAPHRQRRLALR